MDVTEDPNTQPVQIGGFGSMVISLPPHETSVVTHECNLPSTSRMVALMPHMHQTATSIKLELGASAADAKVVYSRDPWNFDQQTVDTMDTTLTQGQYARVTCTYDNTTEKTITYGESSTNEMCFLGVFWVGTPINCVRFR